LENYGGEKEGGGEGGSRVLELFSASSKLGFTNSHENVEGPLRKGKGGRGEGRRRCYVCAVEFDRCFLIYRLASASHDCLISPEGEKKMRQKERGEGGEGGDPAVNQQPQWPL